MIRRYILWQRSLTGRAVSPQENARKQRVDDQKRLEAIRADGVQIVILDSPEIYSEYAPYTYVEDMKEFIDRVSQLNRAA